MSAGLVRTPYMTRNDAVADIPVLDKPGAALDMLTMKQCSGVFHSVHSVLEVVY
jgi:hypothetical protein